MSEQQRPTLTCKNVHCSHMIHASYVERYDGYCLECWNAGVPEYLDRLGSASAEVADLRAALNKIAAWEDGPVVTGKFDAPWAAKIAREALGSAPAF